MDHDKYGFMFAKIIPLMTNLQKLIMPSCQMNDEASTGICEYLKSKESNSLTHFNIGNNSFTAASLTKILRSIIFYKKCITSFDIAFSHFDDDSFKDFKSEDVELEMLYFYEKFSIF